MQSRVEQLTPRGTETALETLHSPEIRGDMPVFLSIFPTTIRRDDFALGVADETAAKFLADFDYAHVAPYVGLAQQGRTVTIEILVDFPWQLLIQRSLRDHCVPWSGFKGDSGDWHRPMMEEHFLQPQERFKATSRDAFFHFGERVLEGLKDTPLQNSSMVVEGFGERRTVINKQGSLTVQVSSEYDIHTLPYDDETRRRFNRDLNELVSLGGDVNSFNNPVLTALRWIDTQEDGGNLEFLTYSNPVQLQRNLMGCSLSEIYITIERTSKQEGQGILYVAAYNEGNKAHRTRFNPNTPYVQAIEPALENLLSDRLDKPVHVRSTFHR